MKRLNLLLALCLLFGCKKKENGKFFEGVITYSTHIVSKNPLIREESLRKIQGDSMRFFMRQGDYKMLYSGSQLEANYYYRSNNILYTHWRGSDSVSGTTCAVPEKPLQSLRYLDTDTTIADRKCRCIEMVSDDMFKKICYDSSLSVDPSLFTNHTWGHADIYYSKTRSLFLSYYLETPFYILRYDAVDVEERELSPEELSVPSGIRVR